MKLFWPIVLLFILLLPTQWLMIKDYKSLDGLIHVQRIKEFHQALGEGQFPVRLAPSLMNEIGYPLFIVNYQLPYYLAELLLHVVDDAFLAYKSVMALTFILGGVSMFWLLYETASLPAAFTGAVIYVYLPYRFANLYHRGALGESASMLFVPLLLLACHKIMRAKKHGVLMLAMSIFGLITSHTVVFIIFAPMLFLFIPIVLKPSLKQLKHIISGVILGVLLSAFQLVPSVLEKNYMKFDNNLLESYRNLFLVYPTIKIPHQGINFGPYYQVGKVGVLIILISIVRLILKKHNRQIVFFLFFSVLAIFLTTSFSRILWENLPGIKFVLYPYRFLNLAIFSIALLGAFVVENWRFRSFTAVVLIASTIYTNRHFVAIAPNFEIPVTANLTTQDEFNTIWSTEKTFIARPLVSTTTDEQISIVEKKPFKVQAVVNSTKPTEVIIRKMYFPGWRVRVNGNEQPIDVYEGLISFPVQAGTWNIEAAFSDTPLRKIANLITLGAVGLLVIVLKISFHWKRLLWRSHG